MSDPANRNVLGALSELFASEKYSDCVVIFCQDLNAPNAKGSAASETAFGEPLPAHRLVLQLASEHLASRLGGSLTPGRAAAAAAPASSRPQLRIPLGSEAELPAARAAIRFAYTGQVAADSSVREVLEVRIQGGYLQINGCAATCDHFLEAKLNGSAAFQATTSAGHGGAAAGRGDGGNGSNKRARTQEPPVLLQRPAVMDLYDCQALWPDGSAASFTALLATGTRMLVAHFGSSLATLNSPYLLEHLLALPVVGLEALLESDNFATDTESSIFLLLATWMRANHERTDPADRQRLYRTVRLAHLSRPYFSLVLPALVADHERDPSGPTGWFSGANAFEAAFIASCASALKSERRWVMRAGHMAPPSIVAALKLDPRAQCIPADTGLSYSWHVTQEQLQRAAELLKPGDPDQYIVGTFDQQPQHGVFAWGFEWRVRLKLTSGQTEAGLYLRCHLPAGLDLPGSRLGGKDSLTRITAVPISARLDVHRPAGQGGAQGNVHRSLVNNEAVHVGSERGWFNFLPLRHQPPPPQQPGAAGGSTVAASTTADPLAAWVDYLQGGKMTGTLTMLRPA